ncbi:MAG TPA: ABC transporter permease [Clostridia bacterium]|nr:ABC transporter permease [Clostridia bacterium]
MKQFWTVFKFEFKNYAKNKSFIIVTALLVVVIGVVLSIPRIQQSMSAGEAGKPEPTEKSVVALIDKTSGNANSAVSYLQSAISDTEFKPVSKSVDELKSAVDSGTYQGAIIINSPLSYTYVVKNIGMYDDFSEKLDTALLAKYRSDKLTQLGVSQADAQSFLNAKVQAETVQTSSGKDQMQNFFYTYILIIMLYMAILLYGQFVATSVATEKSSRAMELLITTTEPKNLMFGKVLGAGLAGLTQFVLILGSSYLFYNINKSYFSDIKVIQSIFNMPLSILLYTILFFVLGFFIYAFLYGALGSLVSRMEELSTAIMPVTMVFLAAFFIVIFSMAGGNVDSVLMKICSYFPLTSPMAMFVRIAMGNVAGWEIAVSVVILVLSTAGIGFLAAAVYRMGVLLYGKAPKPTEIIKMLKNSK